MPHSIERFWSTELQIYKTYNAKTQNAVLCGIWENAETSLVTCSIFY
jgi:hypothetical protein